MPSDLKKPQAGSMSTEQLAEKLEKSEAGRKKLRQAISILQEKLAATDKVLKVNETLRQECDLERQHAAEEKKKAEEEKRLRCILENDNAAFKEQLIKISKRLGVVENKQKSDKKEVDRLRAEVKVAVEGVNAAAQAVDAMQLSFQSLESALLEKVRLAVEEVHTITQAVNAVQGTLQHFENTGVKTVTVDRKPDVPKSRDIPEKLVDDITRLFLKEKKSHVKIEQQLAALKGMLKSSRVDGLLSVTSVDTISEEIVSTKKRVDKCRNKRSRPNEDPAGSKAKKRKTLSPEDEIRKHVLEKKSEREELSRKHKSSRSSDTFKVQVISEKPDSLLQATFQEPSFHMQSKDQVQDKSLQAEGCLLGSSAVPPGGNPNMIPLQSQEKLMIARKEDFKTDLNNGETGMNVYQNDAVLEGSEQDLDFDSSDVELEDDWWSRRKDLLSPNLPEICSPFYDSSSPFMDPWAHKVCTSEATPGRNGLTFESNEDILNIAPTSKADDQHNTVSLNDFDDIQVCDEELENGMNKTALSVCDITLQSRLVEKVEVERISEPRSQYCAVIDMAEVMPYCGSYDSLETDDDHVEEKMNTCMPNQNEIPFQAASELVNCGKDFSLSETFSADVSGTCNTFERKEDTHQKYNGDFGFEELDNSTIKEISNFLEDLPSITCAEAVKDNVATEVTPNLLKLPCDVQMSDPDISRDIIGTSMDDLPANGSANVVSRDMVDMVTKSSGVNSLTEVSKAIEMPDIIIDGMKNPLIEDSRGHVNTIERSSEMALLQVFSLQKVECQINLIVAAIIATKVKSVISFTGLIKQQVELTDILPIDAIQKLPIEYVACSFISTIVEMVKLDSKGEHLSPEAKSLDVLLQTCMVLINNVFKEKSTAIWDIMFIQLGRFLNEGKIILMRFQGIEVLTQDIYISASMIECKGLFSYHYAEATLEDAHAGSKVLAGLCQLFSCVSHLQTVVYEVLGWCDKDAAWLLTIFSSFAYLCGHTSFVVRPDDLLGHAICAIISELVASAEQDVEKLELTVRSAQCSASCQVPKGWEVLKNSLEIEGKLSLEAVLLSVLVVLQHILSPTHDSLLFVSPLFLKDNMLGGNMESSDTGQIRHPYLNHTKNHEGGVSSNKDVRIPEEAAERSLSENHGNKCLASDKLSEEDSRRQAGIPVAQMIVKSMTQDGKGWQTKYCEVIGALELIAVHMGWEWTYNDLIIRHIWRTVISGSSQISIAGISHVLSILGRLGLDSKGKELPGVEELKRCLMYILHSKSTSAATSDAHYFSFLSQAAAAHALLKLDNVVCSKSNESDEQNEIDDPSVQIHENSHSVHMDCVKEWLHNIGEVMQEALPNSFKGCAHCSGPWPS